MTDLDDLAAPATQRQGIADALQRLAAERGAIENRLCCGNALNPLDRRALATPTPHGWPCAHRPVARIQPIPDPPF